MTILLKKIENEFHDDSAVTGSLMSPRLYFDFHVVEAVVRYLIDEPSHKTVEEAKNAFDQFVHQYVIDWKDYNGNSLEDDLNKCFYAWWKGTPAPRTLEQQDKEIENNKTYQSLNGIDQHTFYSEEPLQRVRKKLAQIEDDMQIYGHNDAPGGMSSPFKCANPWLEEKLQGTAKDMRIAFLTTFKGVTEIQIPDLLERKGAFCGDKRKQEKVAKYLTTRIFNNANSITELTGGELPLKRPEVIKWIVKRIKEAGYKKVYAQDSKKWYYLRGNKYTSDPCSNEEDPLKSALDDYYDLSNKWSQEYSVLSYYVDKVTDHLQCDHYLETDIGKGLNLTESQFNDNVLTVGNFCTPHGLYSYTHKISDSNGLTKVCTKANILDQLTNEEIDASEGVQLFGQFLTQIMPKQENRDYLVSVIANAITGYRENEYTYIFHGSTGSNGKSVLRALLQDMLGDYSSNYATDSLVRNSKGNPGEAAKMLEGRRVVFGDEIGDGSVIDGGAFKRYFSNDSYRIRDIYKPAYTVKPTHTMFLPVNQMPNFGSDPAVRRRLVVIPFTEHFVNNPNPNNPHEHKLDPTILQKLIDHEDEIFTYLVRYAEQLRDKNLTFTVPKSIQHYGDTMVDKSNVLVDVISRTFGVQTEEQINDPTIPTPAITRAEWFDLYKMSLSPNTFDPYKTEALAFDALMTKYPQLKYDNSARGTDGKQHYAIRGLWVQRNSTAAIKMLNTRHDNDLNASISYITFRPTLKFYEWQDKKAAEEQRKIKQSSSCNDPVHMHIQITSEA